MIEHIFSPLNLIQFAYICTIHMHMCVCLCVYYCCDILLDFSLTYIASLLVERLTCTCNTSQCKEVP